MLAQYKSAVALPEIRPKNLMPIGQGRRKQMVATVVDTNQDPSNCYSARSAL